MESFYAVIYFVAFALLAGSAFAMMWANIRTISEDMNKPVPYKKHPEAPDAGEEVMYVDLSRDKLEKLYNDESTD